MLIRSPARATVPAGQKSVFLAGSIEMGRAELWQPRVAQHFLDAGHAVFDPRRSDWNAGLAQDPTPGTVFERQVTWEQDYLDVADLVYFRICGGETMAIVSMIELGQTLGHGKTVVIQIDEDYMRWGNVVIMARRYGAFLTAHEDDAIEEALRTLG